MGCVHADGGNPHYVCAACAQEDVQEDAEGAADAALSHPHTTAALAMLLHLGYLRSVFLVGQAVWLRYPTEDQWTDAVGSPELHRMLADVAQILDDIRSLQHVAGAFDEDRLREAARTQHARALAAVEQMAEDFQVDARDLLNVLLHV